MTDSNILIVFGVMYFVLGLGMMLNKKYYRKLFKEFMEFRPMTYLMGILALILGLVLVMFHNTWTQDWGVLVTILGWLTLIKALWVILFPKVFMEGAKAIVKNNIMGVGLLVTVLGIAVSYIGIFVV